MKTLMNYLYRYAKPVGGLLLASVLFTACKKDDVPDNNSNVPVAGLMAFNLAPDQNAVGVSLGGNNLGNSALAYNSFTGNYLPVYTGSRELRSFDNNSNTTLSTSTATFADSSYYSVFVLGANGSYRNVVVKDELDSLTATTGKAWVRYINAIVDTANAPVVTVASNGTDVINETGNYGTVSSFVPVNAGQVSTAVSNGENIAANRTITLEENKIYTLLLTGIPGDADTTRAVQIKFIQNGTVVP